jgi:CDP-glucose 4,6-dehydratase
MVNLDFYKGKRVLVTGHTGFKGTWLCRMLLFAGAEVTGYSLPPEEGANLFHLSQIEGRIQSVMGDVRDLAHLNRVFEQCQPEIVFHLAAQPLVRRSYKEPVLTYDTNVMGTVNILECVRTHDCVRSFLNVTTDKVYENKEHTEGYREDAPLDGYDPYSNSKSCSELVTHSYKRSFFTDGRCAVSTARAGNVIGGGDFAEDRIIPDCVRAAQNGEPILVRNPYSVRPYQHVLEPLYAYLMIAQKQYEDRSYEGYYNVGPDECDCLTTGTLVELFCQKWGEGQQWINMAEVNAPHEATFLKLDCSRLKQIFNWTPRWNAETAIEKVVQWTWVYMEEGDVPACMDRQFMEFMGAEAQ